MYNADESWSFFCQSVIFKNLLTLRPNEDVFLLVASWKAEDLQSSIGYFERCNDKDGIAMTFSEILFFEWHNVLFQNFNFSISHLAKMHNLHFSKIYFTKNLSYLKQDDGFFPTKVSYHQHTQKDLYYLLEQTHFYF